jgi:two-component system chemotaxis response regulator CheB
MQKEILKVPIKLSHHQTSSSQTLKSTKPKCKISTFLPQAVVIASSTGGPAALETIFTGLKGPFKRPLLIAQHMPPVFTQILAKRLSTLTGADFCEAQDGEAVTAGKVYLAPGDYHMEIKVKNGVPFISLNQGPQRNSVRPAADYLFETAAEFWKSSLLGIVLTGMGEDGSVGGHQIRENGGRILIQNKESCVVFGMPGSLFLRDDFDEISDLAGIQQFLRGILL